MNRIEKKALKQIHADPLQRSGEGIIDVLINTVRKTGYTNGINMKFDLPNSYHTLKSLPSESEI